MRTWGIAIDMAKRNEQNLSNMGSKKDTYKKLIAFGNSSRKRLYKYKKAKPGLLAAIRKRIREENRRLKRTRLILVGICTTISLVGLWIIFTT